MKELEYFSTRLPSDIKLQLRVKAVKEKTTVQALTEKAVKELLSKEK